jgi:putative zinc finger protein
VSELALTCSGLTELVTDYLDSTLDERRAVRFETHAVFCPGCRVFLGQMRETVERLHSLPPEPVSAGEREELVAVFRTSA